MPIIQYPKTVDLKKYSGELSQEEAYYGLPNHIEFCKNCTYSNQKPNSSAEFKHTIDSKKSTVMFDQRGFCSACQVAEVKQSIDWVERDRELQALCNQYRRSDGQYDCLIPGSGGKDSFYAAHKLKYEYGMNPLTVTWAPHIYTDWGWKNFQLWNHAGFDNYLFTPNGRVHRLLTRLALEKMYHPFQPFIMGQMYFPTKLALKLNIPLVFYGENPTEYGNNTKGETKPGKDWDTFVSQDYSDIYLAGLSLEELKCHFGLKDVDLEPYLPPLADNVTTMNINVQYLGYYLKWHPQSCYYYAAEHGGFKAAPERTAGTYSKYSGIDDKIDDLHYYTTFTKFGIGRATYDTAQEIRCGDLTREEGVALVKRFDGEYPARFEKECFDYLSLTKKEFPQAVSQFEQPKMNKEYFKRLNNQFRSPHLWQYHDGKWRLRHTVYEKVLGATVLD